MVTDWEWMKDVEKHSKQEGNRRCWGYEPMHGMVLATDGVVLVARKLDEILLQDLPCFRYGQPDKGPLSKPVRPVGRTRMTAFKAVLTPPTCPQCNGTGSIGCTKCNATGLIICHACSREGAECFRCRKTKLEPCPLCVDPSGRQRPDYRFRFGIPVRVADVVINARVVWEPLLELPGEFSVSVGKDLVRLDSPDWTIVVAGVQAEKNDSGIPLEMTGVMPV